MACPIRLMTIPGPRGRAPVYTNSSTKNMNLHLASSHGVTKEYPDGGYRVSSTAGESRIVAAFRRTVAPGLQFNSDMFKQLLVRWIYVTNCNMCTCSANSTQERVLHNLLCLVDLYLI